MNDIVEQEDHASQTWCHEQVDEICDSYTKSVAAQNPVGVPALVSSLIILLFHNNSWFFCAIWLMSYYRKLEAQELFL